MSEPDDRRFADRPAARWLAFLIIMLCAASLAYLHRGDLQTSGLLPWSQDVAVSNSDPVARCRQQRFADIDTMVEEGTIEPTRAELFRQRAEAMCHATEGSGNAADAPASSAPLKLLGSGS